MSTLHSIKKNIIKNTLTFAPEMYNNALGSIIVSAYILSGKKYDVDKIKKTWKKIVKHPNKVKVWLDDPDFIDKALELFEMERPEVFPIAMVQSDFNVLFMPYVNGKLYPLREDGVMPMTGYKGKIYPIDFTNKEENDGNVATNNQEKN